MIGYGFMAKAHSNAWRRIANFFPELEHRPALKAVAARTEGNVKAFADAWGYESVETDWRRLSARDDIDLVDICVPNRLHKEIAHAAAAAGKWVTCEKPLAIDGAEGEEMVAAVERAGVPNMVWYNYRRVPAITLARQLIDEGRIGRPYHYRAQFLQDWTIAPDLPQGRTALWRLDVHAAGSGVTGDLLAHNIDTAMWLNGPITRVMGQTETFVKERLHQETGRVEPVGIDDACMVMARFAKGSLGLFESTRYARGHKALMTLEINGEDGSLSFDLHDPQWLSFFARPTAARSTATPPAGAGSTSPISSTHIWTAGGCRA
jgi:predicted dehydrogenase